MSQLLSTDLTLCWATVTQKKFPFNTKVTQTKRQKKRYKRCKRYTNATLSVDVIHCHISNDAVSCRCRRPLQSRCNVGKKKYKKAAEIFSRTSMRECDSDINGGVSDVPMLANRTGLYRLTKGWRRDYSRAVQVFLLSSFVSLTLDEQYWYGTSTQLWSGQKLQ